MLSNVIVLAWNTVRELVRSKLLYNLFIFAALLIASSMFVAQLTIGQWDRIILDQGLAAIEVVGALVAILIGVNLVAGEIERKTIFPTLAKPVSRGAFLLGRYVGLLAVLAVNVVVMLTLLSVVLHLAGYGLSRTALEAGVLIGVELALLAAVAALFSSFSTPILAAGFSIAFFLIGHLLGDLRAFGERSKSGLARALTGFFYRLLPDLELLNLKSQAASQIAVDHRFVLRSGAYGLTYAAALLVLAALIFRRRDLK
jgi:ABC-type transport system involved in multi-copper enzyme maturation permease subunit